MISLDEARALLGDDAPESDVDVAALRDLVAALVEVTLDSLCTAQERAEDDPLIRAGRDRISTVSACRNVASSV